MTAKQAQPNASNRHLQLTGITRLAVHSKRAERELDMYVFDPHRLALPSWACALGDEAPALLLTLDRHFDLVPPVSRIPHKSAGLRALDEHTRYELDVRNVDHILAACDAGLLSDVVAIARKSPRGALEADTYNGHSIARAQSLEALLTHEAITRIERAERVLLDTDLDCFTTPSDVDPDTILSWPEDAIRAFLMPDEPLWDLVLGKCAAITLAREPYHVGGLVAGGRLFESFARVFFGELLGAELP